MQAKGEETALGVARARFIEGLQRKEKEVVSTIEALSEDPASEKLREELRRRLHALYASAQVFRIEGLAGALKARIDMLDASRDAGRGLSGQELDALSQTAAALVSLAKGDPGVASQPGPVVPRSTSSSKTLRGVTSPMAISSAPPPRPSVPAGVVIPSRPVPPPAQESGLASSMDVLVSVLVLETSEWQDRLRGMLTEDRFEALFSDNPDQALRMARAAEPDVVIVGEELIREKDFVERLRSDPLTDFVPLIVLTSNESTFDATEAGLEATDARLQKPFEEGELIQRILRATGTTGTLTEAHKVSALGDLTLPELSERLFQEFRKGLVDTAESGRDLKIPFGEGTEILAAAWSAVARVRTHVAQKTAGRVRFRDAAQPRRPAMMALVEEEETVSEQDESISLKGRRIIVVDDDPAVVWFFAGVLREEGAQVIEAQDGLEALSAARANRPDVVISDIIMPGLDGFALCRELERDPSLTEVPVILLSWKEDFLQRMRELRAGAKGYLRKEAAAGHILAQVRSALRSRVRLESQLRAGGEVRGRIEGLGMVPLVRTIAKERPSSRLMVRDAFNLFEVEFRDGKLVDITRTASDGGFARGPSVASLLFGCIGGRFAVVDSAAPIRASITSGLDEVIEKATSELRAVLEAVSGKGLAKAAKIRFREEALEGILSASPAPVRTLVEKIKKQGPRELLLTSVVAPAELESTLIDLARRGAIEQVVGEGGEERIGEATPIAHDTVVATSPPEFEIKTKEHALDPSAFIRAASEADSTVKDLKSPFHRPEDGTEPRVALDRTDEDKTEQTESEELDSLLEEEPQVSTPPPVPPFSLSKKLSPPVSSVRRGVGWLLVLFSFGILGFVGFRVLQARNSKLRSMAEQSAMPGNPAPPSTQNQAAIAVDAGQEPDKAASDAASNDAAVGETFAPLSSYGEQLPELLDAGVRVMQTEGLLMIPSAPTANEVEVAVLPYPPNGVPRKLGVPPISAALREGAYELSFRRGDSVSYRYIRVLQGQTRIAPVP